MKKILLAVCLIVFSTAISFSQTNSVLLKSGTGTLISSHGSVQEAYNAVPNPATQAYVVEIQAAYDGSLEIFPVTFTNRGTTETNTITLRPAAGNTGEVLSGNSSTGILVFDDADYVIIDGRPGGAGNSVGLKIENLASTGTNANTIVYKNGSSYNVLRYVHAVNYTQNTSGPRTIVFSTSSTTGNSNNVVRNCKIEGGRSGIGIAGSAGYNNDSISISNCEIFNWGYAGIWLLSAAGNTNVDSCKIYMTAGVNNTIVSGVIASTVAGSTYNFRKNWIYDLQSTSTSTSTAIRGLYFSAPALGSVLNIENNIISLTLDNLNAQTHTGIELLGSTNSYNANVYFNTVKIGGTHNGGTAGNTTSAGIRVSSPVIILNLKNNIAVNTRTGGNVNHTGLALLSPTVSITADYNCFWASAGANNYHAFWGTTGYNDIASYRIMALPQEQNTVFYDVSFVSVTDLHITGSSLGNTNLKGTPVAGIVRDFDGDLRNSVAPYKGADEGNVPLLVSSEPVIVRKYDLLQNFPNPFNPSTTIRFEIPRSEFVTLKVYDIMGREVTSLVNQKLEAGAHEITLHGELMSSGVYFYKLQSGDFAQTRKMTLLK